MKVERMHLPLAGLGQTSGQSSGTVKKTGDSTEEKRRQMQRRYAQAEEDKTSDQPAAAEPTPESQASAEVRVLDIRV